MAEKEISIELSELKRMEIYCSSCETGVVFDVSSGDHAFGVCAFCGAKFHDSVRTALIAYRDFFRAAVKSNMGRSQFRIKAPS